MDARLVISLVLAGLMLAASIADVFEGWQRRLGDPERRR